MIRQVITLRKYDWVIYAYYAVSTYYTDEIMEHLWQIGVDAKNARRAYDNISRGDLDTGLCYSNHKKRKTVLVVAKTSSAGEFLNSLTHEASHACVHIANVIGVDLQSEDYAYMVGDLCCEMYPKVKHLLCEHCRKKHNHDEREYRELA